MLEGKKVVLAYSGGLDTSVCVNWLEQQGAEPYALYLDLGQGEPPEDVKVKALQIGATPSCGTRRRSSPENTSPLR
jgi:argininosuccinate synthase